MLMWFVVTIVDVWCLVVCGDDGEFVVLVWYVVMLVGLWYLCGK